MKKLTLFGVLIFSMSLSAVSRAESLVPTHQKAAVVKRVIDAYLLSAAKFYQERKAPSSVDLNSIRFTYVNDPRLVLVSPYFQLKGFVLTGQGKTAEWEWASIKVLSENGLCHAGEILTKTFDMALIRSPLPIGEAVISASNGRNYFVEVEENLSTLKEVACE